MSYTKPAYHTRNHFFLKYEVKDLINNKHYMCGSLTDIQNIIPTRIPRQCIYGYLNYKLKKTRERRSKFVDWSHWDIKQLKQPIVNMDYAKTITPNHYKIKFKRMYNRVLSELLNKA